MAKTQASVSAFIDVTDLKKLAVDLKAADPEAAKQLRLGLRAAADVVAAAAKIEASWSSTIPDSIKTSAAGALSAKVKAGGAKAPSGAPFENHGQPGTFRHPVFGNKSNWVDQPARPFLAPAADDKSATVEDMVLDAIQTGFTALGLDVL
jgi:hypothetical protein